MKITVVPINVSTTDMFHLSVFTGMTSFTLHLIRVCVDVRKFETCCPQSYRVNPHNSVRGGEQLWSRDRLLGTVGDWRETGL